MADAQRPAQQPARQPGTRLLLISHAFPFDASRYAAESYLQTEIWLLARSFGEILVVADDAGDALVPACPLPANVRAVSLWGRRPQMGALGRAARRACDVALTLGPRWRALVSEMACDPRRIRAKRSFAMRAARLLRRIEETLAREHFAPTHVYGFWLLEAALAQAWLGRSHPGVVTFARAHSYDLYEERSAVRYLPFRRHILDGLDYVFPCSEHGTRYLCERYPDHGAMILTSRLGTRDLPDKSLEAQDGPLRVVSCSRVAEVKRVELLARALRILDGEGHDVAWTHYGDGLLMDAVRREVSGFSSVKAELRGWVPNAELLAECGRRHFDLFVNVSSREGLPISIMEACGQGIPVLATAVGGVPEILRDGHNGLLLPLGADARAVAQGIRRFAEMSPQDRLAMRINARSVWRESFRAVDNVGRLLATIGIDGVGR